MNTYQTYEDLLVWQKAHELVLDIYRFTNETALKTDFALRDQIRRSAISVTSNIVEGHERYGKKEFAYFLNVSKASCSELRSQIRLAKDLNYLGQTECQELEIRLLEVNRMIFGLMKHIKSR